MYQPISFFIGLRYLWNKHLPTFKKIITILSILCISISVSALIIMISMMNGFKEEFKKNILYFTPHIIVTNKDRHVNRFMFPKQLLNVKEIIKFSDFISDEVIIHTHNNIIIGAILGINATNYTDIYRYSIQDVLCKLKSGYNNVIIGKKLAEKLHVKLGDHIKLIVSPSKNIQFPKNFLKEHIFKINDIFCTNNEVDYYQILINQDDAANLLNYPRNHITGWRLWFKNPLSINRHEIKKFTQKFTLLDWKIQKNTLFQAIKIETYIITVLLCLIVLVVICNIVITIMLCVTEKQKSIAILKAHGLKNWKIILIFFILSSSITIIGVVLGIVTSICLIMQKNFLMSFLKVFSNHNEISIIIDLSQIFFITNAILFLTILLNILPSWTIIKLQPVKILYKNE
ncbi:FtsX-like permease family protein [Buchnera aphidicola]|uniref:FtsX-like permease family protein n=1 Tax=Buchnera aphidicola TaxID=9 RepID=UPI0034647BB6